MPKQWSNVAIAKDTDEYVQHIKKLHTETVPYVLLWKQNKLGLDYHPVDWFKAYEEQKKLHQ